MMDPIHIDLRNLSQEHLAQCKPHMGQCQYAAPCVVGTLIAPEERERFDDIAQIELTFPEADGPIAYLLKCGAIVAPINQHQDLIQIQSAYDSKNWSEVERIASKYIGAQAIEAGTAETQGGSVHESAVAESDAP